MESKKLQQLQQANSHLAPIPQTKPPTFQQQQNAGGDYRPSRASPVFQNHPQYQSFASNFAQINYPHQIRPPQQMGQQQQQQQHLSAHSSPKSNSNSLYLSEYSSSSQQQQQQQPSQQQHHHNTIGSHYHFDQIYQQTSSPSSGSGERERLYQTAPRPTQHTHTPSQPGPPQPLTKLELQFQQLQREKIQAQIKTATEALAHQQQTFALRQQLNPPVPNYHLKQNLLQNLSQQHQQQIQHQQQQLQRNAPPSSLNLTSHFQPAQGPMKLSNHGNIHDYGATSATNQHAMNEAFYQQQQQKHIHAVASKTPNNMQSPAPNQIIIQQNIPGQVVNQACQTQISGVKNNQQNQQNQKSPNSDSMSSPSHDGLERRKSGPVHTLKSPVTKRPLNAPVSMSGWLYKQGSDGLKVWRRRWFVLSEYILYYYKGQEEEKLLGTVLLPSYKISACFPEDKVYRKFAFKCEHTNMRTFVFAAETAESMTNWVRALTLATMMQGSSESETSPPSNNARSGDNSDSGIQTYQSQACKTGASQGPVTPVSDNGGGSQPLYANAPPKPRRANDGGYSSPSPEHIPSERYDQDQQQIYGASKASDPSFMQQSPVIKQQQQQHQGYDPNAYPSPAGPGQTIYNDAIYGNAKRIERDLYIQKLIQQQQQQQAQLQQLQQQQQVQQQVQQLAMQQTPQRAFTNPFMYPNADRRTPDTYGPPRAALDKHMSDYEDIYNLTMLSKSLPAEDPSAAAAASGYRRPMSPLRYDGQSMPMRYTPNYLENNNSPAQQQHVQMRARPVQSTIPRPHSADFLEYEARNPIGGANSINGGGAKGKHGAKDGEPARAPRPKSSLDINRTPDNYYYSEASYAEKMRMQSASYLQRAANLGGMAGKEVTGVINSSTVPRDGYYGGGGGSTNGRLDYDENMLHQGSASVPRAQRMTMNNLKKYPSQQEQFARSASARLPRKEEDPSARDGERKREESMKRLLEWKQRMLQSPLTRKMSQQQAQQLGLGSPGSTGNPFLSKSGQLQMEAEMYLEQEKQMQAQHQQQQQQMQQQQQQQMQHLRVDNKSNLEYNSYSSDDEVRNVKNIPKNSLTVKPDPSDYRTDPKLAQGYYDPRQTEYYYQDQESYIRPDISFESTHDLYTQAQLQRAQEINLQQHYQLQDIDRSLAAMNEESPGEKWPAMSQQQQVFTPSRGGPQTPSHHLQQDKSELRTLEMSAGDLLNRTHEELVLLLIQLRRQNSNTARSIEQCCTNIHDIQNSIRMSDGPSRAENLARLEALKKQLCELEKQYEKEKPLINLVDNMVKLGTLYRGAPGSNKGKGKSSATSSSALHASESATLDRLEFNQRIQERRLLQEEQRQWDRLSPNHTELQSKVQQLYQIDQLLQEESGTLQSLQRDKEDLERALGGLKAKIMKGEAPAPAMEAARQQQHTLERELSRVHLMLAENSKKLEKTVADNARLEQELLVLRQKLQASRDTRGSQATLVPGQDGQYVGSATVVLESELRRVQRLVGDMQRQRNELSQAVRQLTDNSDSLHKQINKNGDSRSSHIKKRSQSASWVETDLDSLVCKDQGRHDSTLSLNVSEKQSSVYGRNDLDRSEAFESCSIDSDDLLEDSTGNPFGYPDKQEIKTVRIVKRESERRHRDREKDRSNASTHSLDQVLEEEAQIFEDYNNYHRAKSMPRGVSETHEAFVQNQDVHSYSNNLKDYYSMTANSQNSYPVSMIDRKADLYSGCDRQPVGKTSASKVSTLSLNSSMDGGSVEYSGLRNKTESIQSLTISEQSPVFQSEAAKQIIHEMVGPQQGGSSNGLSASERQKQKAEHLAQQNKHRRSVPKEKRRHHTAPHHVNAKQIEIMQSENDMNKNNVNWRARDDVDLEVTLRPRSNAPDVVRSAMGPREKISEHTIDKLLAAPSKILIPERYVPEQTPELSPEEKRRRQEKVEAIKKMLSETPIAGNDTSPNQPANAEKRQREHLLQLNQILAQQVMQMSKIVADDKPQDQLTENSMAVLPSSISKLRKRGMFNRTNSGRRNSAGATAAAEDEETRYHSEVEDNDVDDDDDDTESPPEPLPLYQQRENYFT